MRLVWEERQHDNYSEWCERGSATIDAGDEGNVGSRHPNANLVFAEFQLGFPDHRPDKTFCLILFQRNWFLHQNIFGKESNKGVRIQNQLMNEKAKLGENRGRT